LAGGIGESGKRYLKRQQLLGWRAGDRYLTEIVHRPRQWFEGSLHQLLQSPAGVLRRAMEKA